MIRLAKCFFLSFNLGSVDSKSYVLVSQLPFDVFRQHVVDETKSPMTGFTFAILAIVQLAGGKIPEGMHYTTIYFGFDAMFYAYDMPLFGPIYGSSLKTIKEFVISLLI